MSMRALRLLQRLLLMGPREIAGRTAIAGRVMSERLRPDGRLSDLADRTLAVSLDLEAGDDIPAARTKLREAMQSRGRPRFFINPDDVKKTSRCAAEMFPEAVDLALRQAEDILAGRFDVLGYRGVDFGNPPSWNFDPVNHDRADAEAFWADLPAADSDYDPKIIWEMHRHQYFQQLGKAYLFSGDDRYADCFVEHLRDWMRCNRPGRGMAWSSSLEVALRAMSWLWAMILFNDRIDDKLLWEMVKWLRLHGVRIEAYLSYYFAPNTHLQGEALGLWMLGTMLPELREADRWRRLGGRILSEALRTHVRPDGVEYEQATYYHRYSIDFFVQRLILGEMNGDPLSAAERDTVQRMAAAAAAMLTPGGTLPMTGDADGGRALRMEEWSPDNPGASLSTAAVITGDGEIKSAARLCDRSPSEKRPRGLAEETVWLLGADAVERYEAIEARERRRCSVGLEDSGCFVMRTSQGEDTDYLCFDCGPMGMPGAGHGHADTLEVELWVGGKPIIIDPGTGSYHPRHRHIWRSTAVHNTVMVDGLDQAVPDGLFRWKCVPRHALERWSPDKGFDYVEGRHDGYERLADPVTHRRKVLSAKREYWLIIDEFIAAGTHEYRWNFQLAPDCIAEAVDGKVTIRNAEVGLLVAASEELDMRVVDGQVAFVYGSETPAAKIECDASACGEATFAFLLLPFEGEPPEATVAVMPDGRVSVVSPEGACFWNIGSAGIFRELADSR